MSPLKRKDSKVTRKEKKKKRKLKIKNERKSKRNRKAKNVSKTKKFKTNKKDKGKLNKKARNKRNRKKIMKKKNSKGKKRNQKFKIVSRLKHTKRLKEKKGRAKKKATRKKTKVKHRKKRINNRKKNKKKKKTSTRKSQKRGQVRKKTLRKTKQDNSSSIPKKLNCDNNTKAVNNFKQNRRFYDKNNLLENKLEKVSIFRSYASLIGKITNGGETCTEEAKAGYLLMNGCETSAAKSCSNTEFQSQYLTAIGCVETINCNTTKIPSECNIKAAQIVEKTKECTNKNIPGTFSYCMSYIKENISTVISDCLDEILTTTTKGTEQAGTTQSTGTKESSGTTDLSKTTESSGITESLGTTESSGTIEPSGTTEPPETLKPSGTTESSGTIEPSGTTEPPETLKPSGTTESSGTPEPPVTLKPSGTTESLGTIEPSGTTEPPETLKPSVTTEPTKMIESITIITGEGGEVVEQKESYNPESNEVSLSVPAHGDNVALKAIIGMDKMVTSYDNYCIVGDPPAYHTTEVSKRYRSTENVDEFESGTVQTVYSFNVVEGELTEAERAELPETFQAACKDKPIQKTKRIEVDESTFKEDSFNSVVTIRKRKSPNDKDSFSSSLDSVNTKKRRISPNKKGSILDSLDSGDTKRRSRIGTRKKDLEYETWNLDLSLSITSRQEGECSSQKVFILFIFYLLIVFYSLREASRKNKHCEVLVSCSGRKIQKDSRRNKQEPSGTACKLL